MAAFDQSSENAAVRGTLLSSYANPLIAAARERQDSLLRERYEGRSLAIADLGCGDGYHGSLFAPGGGPYHGYERSPELAGSTRQRWKAEGLVSAEVFEGELADAKPKDDFYDLAWCLYFTPGNFRDPLDSLDRYDHAYLDANPAFVGILKNFERALKPSGTFYLTVYRDVPAAEEAQFDFYLNTNQHPVTPRGCRFVATREGFWSARWTRDSVLSNLTAAGIDARRVGFNALNEIAWLVEIGGRGR